MFNLPHKFFGVSSETLDPTIFPVCHTQLVQMRHKRQTVRNTELAWLGSAPGSFYRTKKSCRYAVYGVFQSLMPQLCKFSNLSKQTIYYRFYMGKTKPMSGFWSYGLRILIRDWDSVVGTFSPLGDELSAWWKLHNPTVAVTICHEDGSCAGLHSDVSGLAEMILVAPRLHAPSQN